MALISYRWAHLLGLILGCVSALWVKTLCPVVVSHVNSRSRGTRKAYVVWHGQILVALAYPWPRDTGVLVSCSPDGEILATALAMLGFRVFRGSSSARGRQGLAELVDWLRSGHDIVTALDGPRGPYRHIHAGALAAAHRSGCQVVPLVGKCRSAVSLSSWDRFEVPVPFTCVELIEGEGYAPTGREEDFGFLAQRMEESEDALRIPTVKKEKLGSP